MENLDIFNFLGEWQGVSARNIVHRDGLWHQTFHCWIVRERQGKRYIIFRKRDSSKKDSPGALDITAAGHLLAGETPLDGVRELKEELGIEIQENRLRKLGVRIEVIEDEHFHNKEFQHVFMLEDNTKLDNFKLAPGEVSGLVEVELREALALFSQEKEAIKGSAVFLKEGKITCQEHEISIKDFAPILDTYYLNVMIMADLFLDKYPYLAI